MGYVQEDECWKPSEPKVNKSIGGHTDFFSRVVQLRAYKEKHGYLNLREYEDPSLYSFCNNVRQARRAIISGRGTTYKLTDDRIAALDAIGFEWEKSSMATASKNRPIIQQMDEIKEDECWKPSEPKVNKSIGGHKDFFSRVEELKVYKKKHGHLNVRQKENQSLYGFCSNMRRARKGKGKHTLDDNRIAALDAIGFKWEMVDTRAVFFAQVDELKAYKEKHGHLKVDQKEDKSLYIFCYNVRQAQRDPKCTRTKLTEDRIAALDAIGFDWKLEAGASFSVASKDDKQKYTTESSVQPPSTEAGVSSRGRTRKMSRAMAESVSQQAFYEDTTAFRGDSFFARVDKLKAYKEKNGHINVRYKEDPSLYNFCCNLRSSQRYPKCNRTKLTKDKVAALDAIGFEWGKSSMAIAASKDASFFVWVEELKAYKERHGHINVREVDGLCLHNFCTDVRQTRRAITSGKGKREYRLDDCRISALDAIGFNWEYVTGASSESM
jgi:hypothetical protein